ncbi:MAG: 16S rRNA (guanine(966)-N(2))-methyltransferase RsmD [Acidobacteriota bacterium]
MRIIAGTLKGRRLEPPSAPGVRPTSDKLRETLFNVLRDAVADARVLDGFAGTGAVGLEALSRGAAHVTFVDRDPRALAVVSRNIAACGLAAAAATARGTFIDFCVAAGAGPSRFDLIFLDPPYDAPDLDAIVAAAAGVAGGDAVIVLEHSRRRVPPPSGLGVEQRRRLSSGDSALALDAAAPAGAAAGESAEP